MKTAVKTELVLIEVVLRAFSLCRKQFNLIETTIFTNCLHAVHRRFTIAF